MDWWSDGQSPQTGLSDRFVGGPGNEKNAIQGATIGDLAHIAVVGLSARHQEWFACASRAEAKSQPAAGRD